LFETVHSINVLPRVMVVFYKTGKFFKKFIFVPKSFPTGQFGMFFPVYELVIAFPFILKQFA